MPIGQIIDVAIAIEHHSSSTHGNRVGNWHVNHPLFALMTVIANFNIYRASKGVYFRHGSYEVYRATGGITAIQRTLRATQYFDAIHVKKLDSRQVGSERNVVDMS